MLSVIIGLFLRVCREEGNVSAQVSHSTAQALFPEVSHTVDNYYRRRCPTRCVQGTYAQRMNSLLLLLSTFIVFIDKTTTWENLIMECFIPIEMHVKIWTVMDSRVILSGLRDILRCRLTASALCPYLTLDLTSRYCEFVRSRILTQFI